MQTRRDDLFGGSVPAGYFIRSVAAFEGSSRGMFRDRFERCSVQLVFRNASDKGWTPLRFSQPTPQLKERQPDQPNQLQIKQLSGAILIYVAINRKDCHQPVELALLEEAARPVCRPRL
jgi:hypothetical protein